MRRPLCTVLVAALAAFPLSARAAEHLEPLSMTALSITGPIDFDPTRVTFAGKATLTLASTGAAVPFDGGFGVGRVEADLYRVLTPHDPVLLNKNRLCGAGKPLTYLLVWRTKGISGPVTTLAPSTSDTPPATMDDICGTYSFVPK